MDKIGPVFPEFISTEKIKRRGNYHDKEAPRSMRFYIIPLAIFLGISILFLRLFYLQIVQGSYYRTLSDTNRIKTVIIHAPRGTIFDRNGKPLVFNVPGFRKTDKN